MTLLRLNDDILRTYVWVQRSTCVRMAAASLCVGFCLPLPSPEVRFLWYKSQSSLTPDPRASRSWVVGGLDKITCDDVLLSQQCKSHTFFLRESWSPLLTNGEDSEAQTAARRQNSNQESVVRCSALFLDFPRARLNCSCRTLLYSNSEAWRTKLTT